MIEQAERIANEIAQANAFDYAGNYGRGTFRFAIAVRRSGDQITFSAKVNACISIERAREEMTKFWSAFVARMTEGAAADGVTMLRRNGSLVWRQGDWHMGHFHTSGIARAVKVAQ